MTAHPADGAPVSYGPGTFSDVDASGQAAEHAAYLDRLADLFADLRRSWLSYLELQPGEVVLDAGSGMGEVTRALATMVAPAGRAIGVDLSADLVERANERAASTPDVDYRVGDLTHLPFEDATFDVAYCERVFQHLAEPDRGMAELFRVLRPGGRLAAVDPDFTRSAQDADDSNVSDILTAAARRAVANPSSGRQLRSKMVGAGFVEVAVHPTLLVTTDAVRFRALSPRSLEERLKDLVAAGSLARDRADAFVADQDQREANGCFLVATPLYCATATKPAEKNDVRTAPGAPV
jgi:SAM-dependent methyltransferase